MYKRNIGLSVTLDPLEVRAHHEQATSIVPLLFAVFQDECTIRLLSKV